MRASVIVCTYNRAHSLEHTIRCLANQQVKKGTEWELIVVNNNSTDDTADVVNSFDELFTHCRYEFEAKQGLSHARNRGIACAQGEILLFTDDDVCPEPNWIQTTLDAFDSSGCDACGGSIAPVWEISPPPWLTERFYGFLALRISDGEVHRITESKTLPYGANMAFRKSVFDRVGLFDITRGRKGNVLASGEDGELFDRILRSGMKVMFFPQSLVHHRIEAFRLSKSYFRRWRYQTSENIAISRGLPGKHRFLGIPLYLFPQLIRASWQAVRAKFLYASDEAFFREMIIWHFLGTIRGLYTTRNTV